MLNVHPEHTSSPHPSHHSLIYTLYRNIWFLLPFPCTTSTLSLQNHLQLKQNVWESEIYNIYSDPSAHQVYADSPFYMNPTLIKCCIHPTFSSTPSRFYTHLQPRSNLQWPIHLPTLYVFGVWEEVRACGGNPLAHTVRIEPVSLVPWGNNFTSCITVPCTLRPLLTIFFCVADFPHPLLSEMPSAA